METKNLYLTNLFNIVNQHNQMFEKFQNIPSNYFEPGKMENLDQYEGLIDEKNKIITLKTPIKGLKYNDRSKVVEFLNNGDNVVIERDELNQYNSNNFVVKTIKMKEIGYLDASLCNSLAPLFDNNLITIVESSISYLERLSERSRYAVQAIVFIKLILKF